MSKPPKHILVIRLSAMGDVAMTVPVLRAFTEQYPEVNITVLTRAVFKPFFRDLENVSVFKIDVKGKHKGVLGLWKLTKELKKHSAKLPLLNHEIFLNKRDQKSRNIDAIADLHNVLRSNILKFFFFEKKFVQIDKGRAEKKALISGQKFEQLKTTHQRYADVFEKLGFKIDLSKPSFQKPQGLSDKIFSVIERDNKTWIGIAPFAAHLSKMYPLDLMEIVIESLSKKYKIILFGGGEKEILLLNKIEEKYENVFSVAGKLSLDEELDLISNLNVMLSMDSGNAHLAAMLGIKVITIWGVTHPFAGFSPFNQPEDYALVSDRAQFPKIPTSVYGNKFPEGYENASQSISPKTIIEKIESLITAKEEI